MLIVTMSLFVAKPHGVFFLFILFSFSLFFHPNNDAERGDRGMQRVELLTEYRKTLNWLKTSSGIIAPTLKGKH